MTASNRARGIALTALLTLPTMALAALVAVLPALFRQFAPVPHHEWLVPMILTLPSVCVAAFSTPIGLLADRWRRRPILLMALAAFALFGVLPMLFDSLYAILASRFVVGVAEAAILTVGNAMLGDYFEPVERRHWLAVQSSLGPFIGSAYILMGGWLGDWSWHAPFLLYLLGGAALALAWFALEEPARQPADARVMATEPFPWHKSALLGLVTVATSIVFFVQAVQHGRIFGDLGLTSTGRIANIVVIASMGTVLGGLYFKFSKARGVPMLLAQALACYGISYIGVALSADWRIGLPFDALGQFGSGILLPTLILWALSCYPLELRGRGMGIWSTCFFLGQFLSPPALGLIAHGRLGFLASVGVLGFLCLLGAAYAFLRARRVGTADELRA